MFKKIEISHRTIIFSVLFLLFLGFIYLVRDIILELFVALLLTAILEPIVALFSKIKIPRPFAVLLTYILLLGFFGGIVSLIVPSLIEQTTSFVNALPGYVNNIGIRPEWSNQIVNGFLATASTIPGQVVEITFSVFGNFLAIISVLVFAFYFLLSRDKLDGQIGSFFGDDNEKKFTRIIGELERRLGGWARGEIILMFMIGLGVYIGLLILGIPYALPLSILSGLLEIVPFLGPVISAVPGVLIGIGMSPLMGMGVAALYFLVHQLEGYILVPKIMEKSVGVSPVVTLIALAVGARLAGIVGVIVSVPTVITLQVFIREYINKD